MNPTLIPRAKALLLSPTATWREIALEPTDIRSLFTGYVLWLAAIPAVAGFIGGSLVGVRVLGIGVRVPVLAGLTQMVVSYLLSLVGIVVLAWLIDTLAPRFGGEPDRLRATKLAAYSATASFIGGVFAVLPALALLGVLCGLYSLVLLYLGLPLLMRNRPEKTLTYTVVLVVCAVVMSLVVGAVSSLVLPRAVTSSQALGDAEVGTEAFNEALARRAAKAAESGDASDLAAVMAGAAAAVAGAVATGAETSDGSEAANAAAAAAMLANTRDVLRRAAAAQGAGGEAEAEAEAEANAADADPATEIANAADAAAASPYGYGKRKLAAPVVARCLSRAELDAAAFGTGCTCDCAEYARGASRNCLAACSTAYYACWAPDPTDAELAAALPADLRPMLEAMPAAERAQMRDSLAQSQLLSRAIAWREQTLACADGG